MSATTIPLIAAFCGQILLGLPLLQPLKVLHGPSIAMYKFLTHGAGLYVGITMTVILTSLFASSVFESFSERQAGEGGDGKALMSAATVARAELSAVLCAANMAMAATFMRLSVETAFHDRLKVSHSALQKQAGGLSDEYKRATENATAADKAAQSMKTSIAKGDRDGAEEELAKMTEELLALKDQLSEAQKSQTTADKLATDLRLQYTGLEESFDTLMRENEALKRGQVGASTSTKEE